VAFVVSQIFISIKTPIATVGDTTVYVSSEYAPLEHDVFASCNSFLTFAQSVCDGPDGTSKKVGIAITLTLDPYLHPV
jgi:hypothetical protein